MPEEVLRASQGLGLDPAISSIPGPQTAVQCGQNERLICFPRSQLHHILNLAQKPVRVPEVTPLFRILARPDQKVRNPGSASFVLFPQKQHHPLRPQTREHHAQGGKQKWD